MTTLGYTDVRTHLNSGNAVFATATDPAELAEQLGMRIRCLLRNRAELLSVIEDNPLRAVATDGSRMMVNFLSAPPDSALLAAHDPHKLDPATIFLGDRVIYQWCPDGVLAAPPAGGFAEKHLKVTVTARNWNTITKLATLLDG